MEYMLFISVLPYSVIFLSSSSLYHLLPPLFADSRIQRKERMVALQKYFHIF